MATISFSPSRKRKSRGQGLVEFALITPLLFALLFGVVDLGWILFGYNQMFNAMRETMRFGSVPGYTTPPQYEDCAQIRATFTRVAGNIPGFNAGTQVAIAYDNGVPIAFTNNNGTPNPTAGFVAYCAGNTLNKTRALQSGDRINVTVDTKIRFLTPFLQALASGGLNVKMTSARTIFLGIRIE